jgi:hypothetical protein
MIVYPKDTNVSFTDNGDGTYTWGYLRINVNGIQPGNYVDIAEIAFADNQEAAEYYAREDAAVLFNVNFDGVNATIDNVSFTDSIWSDRVVTLDMSQYAAFQTPTSLSMGGWICVPGGVKGYYVRVTHVDGEAVQNPTLTKWASATHRDDIYNAAGAGKGYSNLCASGAGMTKTPIDLTAYAGHKVDLELVAITNFGVELVYTKIINITVPAAE